MTSRGTLHRGSGLCRPLLRALDSRAGRVLTVRRRYRLAAAACTSHQIPRLLALVAALLVTLLVVTVLGYLIVWAFGTVGRWLIENALRFQALYIQSRDWLEEHGILVTSLLVENFNASWLIRAVQEIGGRLHGLVTFSRWRSSDPGDWPSWYFWASISSSS